MTTTPEGMRDGSGVVALRPDAERALLRRYLAPRWAALAAVGALTVLSTGLALAQPFLTKWLVDRALLGRDLRALGITIAAFVALTAASFIINVVAGLRYTRLSADLLFDMRRDVFEHLQRLGPSFHARTPLGQIASRINTDISEIQRVAAEVVLAWIGHLVFLVGAIVMLLRLDPVLFAVSLAAFPLALWALVAYRRRLEGAVAQTRDRGAAVGTFLVEALQAMRTIVGANAQQRTVAALTAQNGAFVEAVMAMRRLTYVAGGLPGLLLAAGSGLVFYVGGTRVIDGTISLGTLVAFVAYQVRLLAPIQGLMGLYTSVATARVSLRRVHEILDAAPDVTEAPDAVRWAPSAGAIRFDRVSFSFDRGTVLRDLSFEIAGGERVAIVGVSGAGKSTLIDLLVRHHDPEEGRVLLDGHDVRRVALRDVRGAVGVVEYDPFIFNASLADNVRLAAPDAPEAAVVAAIRAAGLEPLVARLPRGADTILGERGRLISTGERQRVGIARALLAQPAVVVCDEATAALDPETEALVAAAIERAFAGRTIVWVTHRRGIATRADRVLVLRDGRIAADLSAAAFAQEREQWFDGLSPAGHAPNA